MSEALSSRNITLSRTQTSLLYNLQQGRDVILKDVTGSGKTFGMVVACLSRSLDFVQKEKENIAPVTDLFQTSSIQRAILSQKKQVDVKKTCVIWMVPTRELALQIYSWTQGLAKDLNHEEFKTTDDWIQCIFAGLDSNELLSRFKANPPAILIGTPKILNEWLEKGDIHAGDVKLLVLDEVDGMVDAPTRYANKHSNSNKHRHDPPAHSFLNSLFVKYRQARSAQEAIKLDSTVEKLKSLDHAQALNEKLAPVKTVTASEKIQVVAISATLSASLRFALSSRIVADCLKDPAIIDPAGSARNPTELKHEAYEFDKTLQSFVKVQFDQEVCSKIEEKTEEGVYQEHVPAPSSKALKVMVKGVVSILGSSKAIVVLPETAAYKDTIQFFEEQGIKAAGFVDLIKDASQILSNSEVKPMYSDFIDGDVQVLVLRQSWARGLDFPGIQNVFIMGVPKSDATYNHLAGRASRFGKNGRVATLLSVDTNATNEKKRLQALWKRVGIMTYKPVRELVTLSKQATIEARSPIRKKTIRKVQ